MRTWLAAETHLADGEFLQVEVLFGRIITDCKGYERGRERFVQDAAERTPRFERVIARTVMKSTSSNSGVRAVFNIYHGVVGRTTSLYC